MQAFLIEMKHPHYGFERFRIKIIRKYNMRVDEISPKISTRPKPTLSGIYVGRNVKTREIKDYLENYYREKGLFPYIMRMKVL